MKHFVLQHKYLLIVTLFFSCLASAGGVGIALILQYVIDAALEGNWALFRKTIVFTILYLILLCILSYAYNVASKKFIKRMTISIRDHIFQGLFQKKTGSFLETNSADYISALTNDVKLIEENYIQPFLSIIQNVIVFIASLVLLLYISPIVTFSLIGLTLLMFIVPSLLGGALQKKQTALSKQMSTFTMKIKDLLSGYEVISSYGMKKQAINDFQQENIETGKIRYRVDRLLALNESLSNSLAMLTQFSVVFISAYLIISGKLSGGNLVALVQLSGGFVGPVLVIMQSFPMLQGIKPVIERLNDFSNTIKSESSVNKNIVVSAPRIIQLDQISFSYQKEQNKPTLTSLDFTFICGKKYAIVGRSGSGKSTLIKLLSGYYDTYKGKILVDGIDVKDLGDGILQSICSTINQNVYLFDTDIKYNIDLNEDFSEERWNEIIEKSGLADFLGTLPLGYHSPVGENGASLSGGQKQRISLARALIRNKPILLLDEGTSAIDMQMALEIERTLIKNKDLTLITITHQMNEDTLSNYDLILYMEDGRIVEQGSFRELINIDGKFKAFYSLEQKVEAS